MLPFPGISSGVRKEPPRAKILESPSDPSTNQIVGFSQQPQSRPTNESPEQVMAHGSTSAMANSKKYYGVSQQQNRIRHIHSENQFQSPTFQEWRSLIG